MQLITKSRLARFILGASAFLSWAGLTIYCVFVVVVVSYAIYSTTKRLGFLHGVLIPIATVGAVVGAVIGVIIAFNQLEKWAKAHHEDNKK